MATVRHYHHHYHFSYLTSFRRHISSMVIVLMVLVFFLLLAFRLVAPNSPPPVTQLGVGDIFLASLSTIYRLFLAYIFALFISVPLALLITANARTEKILLPLFDIVQSIPVLAFLPLVVLVFIKLNLFDGAAIFIVVADIVWSLVFSMVGGLKSIPNDIKAAASVFGASGLNRLWHVTLPAIVPYIITGSFLAWGQGWNVIVIAEVLHNYIPQGSPSQDLFGLGSILVSTAVSGQSSIFVSALITMVAIIGVLNFFVWQKLIHLTERFKFD